MDNKSSNDVGNVIFQKSVGEKKNIHDWQI